jgi:class 3 adenylate cyclase/ActR/RegA family two-component response regulator
VTSNRILLVQSEENASHTLMHLFEQRGDEVWTATQLEEATALCDLLHPKMLVFDLHFPGDAWEDFLDEAHRMDPTLRTIITTRYPDLQRELLAQQNGAHVFLRQPFTEYWLERALNLVEAPNVKAVNGFQEKYQFPLWLKIALPFIALLMVFAISITLLIQPEEPFLQISIAAIFLVLLTGGIFLGLYLSKQIIDPLAHLNRAINELRDGNFTIKVDTRVQYEFVEILHSFNKMIARVQERMIFRDLFGFPQTLEAEEKLRRSLSIESLKLNGCEAEVAQIVVTFQDFSDLVTRTSTGNLFDWLNEAFQQLAPEITSRGGVVERFEGERFNAYFGIIPQPIQKKLSIRAACEASFEMLKVLKTLNVSRRKRGDPCLKVHFLIHSGPVRAGGLGFKESMHYSLLGETSRVAQQLASLAASHLNRSCIIISETARLALGEACDEWVFETIEPFTQGGTNVFRLTQIDR